MHAWIRGLWFCSIVAATWPTPATAADLMERLNVGGGYPSQDRYVGVTCRQTCLFWDFTDLAGQTTRVCEEWGQRCDSTASKIGLYLPAANGVVRDEDAFLVRPYYPAGDISYMGCGRKSAQNALAFFDVQLPQAQVAQYVKATRFPNGNIATWPDDLRNGLQQVLDQSAPERFLVRRTSHVGTPELLQALRTGMPVMALVKGGTHWVTVVGHDTSRGFAVLNDWSLEWWPTVDLSFSTLSSIYGTVTDNSFQEGTIITFERIYPSIDLDAYAYLHGYVDLAAAFGSDYAAATAHWYDSGAAEGRRSSLHFDVRYYLARYGDLQDAFGADNFAAADAHWRNYGLDEGRQGSLAFDVAYYLAQNADVRAEVGAGNHRGALDHWLRRGLLDGRPSAPGFHAAYYLAQYPDLQAAFGPRNYLAAAWHWVNYGYSEGRRGAP